MKNLGVFILALVLTGSAASATEVGVLGGLGMTASTYSDNQATSTSTKGYSTAAYGLFIERSLGGSFGLELEAVHIDKKHDITDATLFSPGNGYQSTTLTLESYSWIVPLIFRVYTSPSHILSLGVGPYYEIGTSYGVDGTNAGVTVNQTYANSTLNHNDVGVVGSLRGSFPLGGKARFSVDARYLYGLNEQWTAPNNAALSTKNRYIQVLGGLSFAL